MSTTRTFRQLLNQHQDNTDLFEWLFDKHHVHKELTDDEKVERRQRNHIAYSKVIKELLSKKPTKAGSMPICVYWTVNYGETERYITTVFKNLKYVAPKKGLKPWGGANPPKGHYNCNANRHNQYFAFGYEKWSKIIDTPVVIDGDEKISDVEMLGAILWELTFHGWTEKKVEAFKKDLFASFKAAKKEIAEGKCRTIKSKKKGGFDVVIPNRVTKQINEIAKGK